MSSAPDAQRGKSRRSILVLLPLVFFIGLAAGVAVLWGFSIIRFGIKRSMQRRRERKQLTELSEKLERVEGERRDDDTDTSKL